MNRISRGCLVALFALGLGLSVSAAEKKAELTEEQLKKLNEEAAHGDPGAMVQLAQWHVDKETAEDDRRAAELFQRVVDKEKSNAVAMVGLGRLYRRGFETGQMKEGKPELVQDEKKAFALFQKASESNADGMDELATCYRTGKGVAKDDKKANELFEKAMKGGNLDAIISLGDAYEDGLGVEVDGKKALDYYRKAADQGSAYAMYEVGHCYEEGIGADKDIKQMIGWYQKSAEGGDPSGMMQMATAYRMGRGASMNRDTAREWYKKAALKGEHDGIFEIGQMSEEDKQMEDALKFYKLGKERGNEKCAKRLEELKVKD